MQSYCLKCRRNAQSKNPKVVKTKNRRIMVHQTVSSKLIKQEEVKGLFGSRLIRIPILGPLLM